MQRRWGRRSHASRRVAVGLALGVFALPTVALVLATSEPAAAVDGLRLAATSTYVLDPAAAAIHVTVDMTATNVTPDEYRGNVIEQAYFPGVIVPALAEATNFSATNDSGSALSVTSQPASVPIAQELTVHFASNLFYNHTQTVHLHYDLPNGAPRSKSLTRATPAFASFDAWSVGDAGSSNVTIVVPRAFTVDVVGDTMTQQAVGATVTYSATAIASPDTWFVSVSARDDSKLVSRSLTVGGHPVKVRALPNDPVWGAFVSRRVTSGLPKLEQLIGLPWTAGNRLLITETVTPYLYGYAGWYSTRDNVIEIGDALDPQVVLHEMSHMWFSNLLFDERWIDEGLAQEYAARANSALGGKPAAPKPVNPHDAGAMRLEAWSQVDLQNQVSEARETFGYNASWYVVHRLAHEIGIRGMQRVFAAASKDALPYVGARTPAANPEAAGGAGSWKRFLDYLDETGGSKKADSLFAKYVARPDDHSIATRKQARASYARLVAAGKGWKAPLVLRQAMTDWDFSTAATLIDRANRVTATHDEIEHSLAPLGLHAPEKLQADYEYRVADLGTVAQEATADATAAHELVSASAAVHGSHGLFAKIGLLGASDGTDLAHARSALVAGDATQATAAARAAEHVVADAGSAGQLRSALALGTLVFVVVLAGLGRALTRRRRARAAAAAAVAAPAWPVPPPAEGASVGADAGGRNEPVDSEPAG